MDREHCPHCHGMSEAELVELKDKIIQEYEGNKNLGRLFFIAAIVILVLIILVFV
jgi:hypothetical protein